jgi:hypothetical protein
MATAGRKKQAGTDYAKFDRIDWKSLGADDDDERPRKERDEATRTGPPEDSPEGQMQAYLKHQAEVESAKKRLAELEVEQKAAELKLLELERQRKFTDRIMIGLAVAFCVLMALVNWYAQQQPTSRYTPVDL